MPVASGTFGTLVGVPLALALAVWYQAWWWQVAVALVMTLLAVPVCEAAERHFGKKDDGRIVADEWMLFPLCTIGLPLLEHWMVLLPLCFVVSRACDVIKPPPARQLQVLPGGTGIVIDDFIASLYALAINHLLWWLVLA
jgi:phosphatidylglycerophosphatase A